MKTYDWIVVGGGIAGAALAYELVKTGFAVLLLEQYEAPQNAWIGFLALIWVFIMTQIYRQSCQMDF